MSIELQNIQKSFGSFRALSDINLVVPEGKLVALLGPSGSGKTTLLRLIAGFERPDLGQVRYANKDWSSAHVRERNIGFVFQHYALFRHMSVYENVAFGLRVMPRKKRPSKEAIDQRVRELLKLVQLENLAKRMPSQLSGGQRQRVALARALAVEPKVLLLDEPFGALDAQVRKELRAWLKRLHHDIKVTTVFVTHDQEEALEVADVVVVMHQGKIEQIGTPDELFHQPKTEFVLRFLGDVNVFRGRGDGAKIELAAPGASEASQKFFARPHELTLDTDAGGLPAVQAKIVHVHSAGPMVRVEVKTPDGTRLDVDLSHERWASLKLAAGQDVWVRMRHIRVFGGSSGS